MARNEHTPEQFDAIAADLIAAAKSLELISQSLRDCGMPHALIHGSTLQSLHLPAVLDWVDKAGSDSRAQIRAYTTGNRSQAEILKELNDAQKLAAAKKPFVPKKTVKKKAT